MKKSLFITLFLILLMENIMAKSDFIELYSAYTNGSRLIINGRVIDIKDKKSKESKLYSAFFNNEKKGARVYLVVGQEHFSLKSDDEAYFRFDIRLKNRLKRGKSISLQSKDRGSLEKIYPFFPTLSQQIGVISDFDDTVIISDVTSKVKLLYNTFFKNYKERTLVFDVARNIKNILKNNHLNKDIALFFISGSPHQFNNNINNFLDYHAFQKRTVLTKKIHGQNSASLHATVSYKYDKIVRLIDMYPQVTWVLFGDSGEKDTQIYKKIRNEYPQKIRAVYIRDVERKIVEEVE